MSIYQDIIAEATAEFANHQTWTNERDVLLCDFNGNIVAANAMYPHSVYWHNLPGEIHEQGTAVLSMDSNILYEENAAYASNPPHITIGYPPRSRILTVKGGSSTVAAIQAQGNASQLEQKINAVGNPHIYNIVDFRLRPTDTPSSSVYMEAGIYEQPSWPGHPLYWPGGTFDLAGTLGALTSGQHQMGVVYFNRETGRPGVATSAAVSAVGSLPSRSELGTSTLATIYLTAKQKPCGVVYLYYGQATVAQADLYSLYDPRLDFTLTPATSLVFHNDNLVSHNDEEVVI